MLYHIKITPTALNDLQQGIDYYQLQQKGLGKRFSNVIETTLEKIKLMPHAASIAYNDVRYKIVDKFSYVVLYKIHNDDILILRIFNTYQQFNFNEI